MMVSVVCCVGVRTECQVTVQVNWIGASRCIRCTGVPQVVYD